MIKFRPILLTDKEWMDELFALSDYRGCEYDFGNNYNWAGAFDLRIAREGDLLLTLSRRDDGSHSYSYPAGGGDMAAAVEMCIEDANERDADFHMHGVVPEQKEFLEKNFPGRFKFEPYRDGFDYIYLRSRLAELTGKKLHAKRNFINRFEASHDWSYEPITTENLEECREMNARWCQQNDCYYNEDLREETCAGQKAFNYFVEEQLEGGLLRAEGEVVAFTMGAPLCSDTFDIHIEKAFSHIDGAYPMINREFVRRLPEKYVYVNREEDVGDEGLRKAKLSYEPDILLEKNAVELI